MDTTKTEPCVLTAKDFGRGGTVLIAYDRDSVHAEEMALQQLSPNGQFGLVTRKSDGGSMWVRLSSVFIVDEL